MSEAVDKSVNMIMAGLREVDDFSLFISSVVFHAWGAKSSEELQEFTHKLNVEFVKYMEQYNQNLLEGTGDYKLPRHMMKDGIHVFRSARTVYGFIEDDILEVADKRLVVLTEDELDRASHDFENGLAAANEEWQETAAMALDKVAPAPIDCPVCHQGMVEADDADGLEGPVECSCFSCGSKFTATPTPWGVDLKQNEDESEDE